MLLAAEKKNGGTPPSSLDHAKIILSDNVWILSRAAARHSVATVQRANTSQPDPFTGARNGFGQHAPHRSAALWPAETVIML